MARSIAAGPVAPLLLRDGHAKVVEHGQAGEDAPSLGDVGEAEFADVVGRLPRDGDAIEGHATGGRGHES